MSAYKKNYSGHNPIETLSTLAFVGILFGILFRLEVLFYVALFFLFIGIFIKGLSYKISRLWLKFADFIGHINTRILLTLAFFFLLTPIAFIYRLFHRDSLNIRNKSTEESFWHSRTHIYQPKDFENMW